jgi:hypothetical protein
MNLTFPLSIQNPGSRQIKNTRIGKNSNLPRPGPTSALLHVHASASKSPLLMKLNESAGSNPDYSFEKARKVTLVGKPDVGSHAGYAAAFQEKIYRLLYPELNQIFMG